MRGAAVGGAAAIGAAPIVLRTGYRLPAAVRPRRPAARTRRRACLRHHPHRPPPPPWPGPPRKRTSRAMISVMYFLLPSLSSVAAVGDAALDDTPAGPWRGTGRRFRPAFPTRRCCATRSFPASGPADRSTSQWWRPRTLATARPLGVKRTSGSRPRLPMMMALLTTVPSLSNVPEVGQAERRGASSSCRIGARTLATRLPGRQGCSAAAPRMAAPACRNALTPSAPGLMSAPVVLRMVRNFLTAQGFADPPRPRGGSRYARPARYSGFATERNPARHPARRSRRDRPQLPACSSTTA